MCPPKLQPSRAGPTCIPRCAGAGLWRRCTALRILASIFSQPVPTVVCTALDHLRAVNPAKLWMPRAATDEPHYEHATADDNQDNQQAFTIGHESVHSRN